MDLHEEAVEPIIANVKRIEQEYEDGIKDLKISMIFNPLDNFYLIKHSNDGSDKSYTDCFPFKRKTGLIPLLLIELKKLSVLNKKITYAAFKWTNFEDPMFVSLSCATLEEKVKELQKVELKDFIHFAFQCLDTDIEICFFDDPDREKGNRMLFTGGYFNPLATDDLMNKLRNSGVFDDIKVGFIGTIKDDAFELVEICVEEIAKKVVQRIKSQIYKEEPSGDENDESQKRGSGRSLRSHDRSQTVDLTEDDREAGAGDEDSEISSLLFYEVATSDLHEPGTVDETVVEFWNGTEAIMVHKSYDVEFMDFWLLTSEFDGFPQDKIELPSLNAMKKEFEIMKREHRKGIKEPSPPAEPRRISMKEVSSAIASAFEETHKPKKPQQPRHSQDHRQKSRPGGSQGTSQSSQSSFTIVSANPKNPVTRRRIPTSFQQARALDRLTHNIKNASSSTSPSMYEKVFEGENVEIIEPDREPDDNDVVVVDDDNKGHSDENNNQPENQQRQKKKKKLFFMVNP